MSIYDHDPLSIWELAHRWCGLDPDATTAAPSAECAVSRSNMITIANTLTIHNGMRTHSFALRLAPQCGQAFALVLTSPPQSAQLNVATHVPFRSTTSPITSASSPRPI